MFHLLPYLSVVDNVVLAANSAGNPEVLQQAETLLERLLEAADEGNRVGSVIEILVL